MDVALAQVAQDYGKFVSVANDLHIMVGYIRELRVLLFVIISTAYFGILLWILAKLFRWYRKRDRDRKRPRSHARRNEDATLLGVTVRDKEKAPPERPRLEFVEDDRK